MEFTFTETESQSLDKLVSVRQICHLRDSADLARVMEEIEANQERKGEVAGPVEADPEYQLIVEANSLAVEIDNEVGAIHKFTREKYSKRFPELESLVASPLEYLKTVKELGNDLDKAKNNAVLPNFLTQATIMVVSVTASTTQGYPITATCYTSNRYLILLQNLIMCLILYLQSSSHWS